MSERDTRQQRGDTQGNVMQEPKVAKAEEYLQAARMRVMYEVLARGDNKSNENQSQRPHFTDLGSQLRIFPEPHYLCHPLYVYNIVTPQQSFIQLPPEPEPGGNSCRPPGRVTGDIFPLGYPDA